MQCLKPFYLKRLEDESGVSGTGIVAVGAILPSGKVVLEWQTFHSSINIYQTFDSIEEIHGHAGKTLVIMGNPNEQEKQKPKAKSKTKAKVKK